jgi:hypothetical protein
MAMDEEFPTLSRMEKIKKAAPLFIFGIYLSTFASYSMRSGETKAFKPKDEHISRGQVFTVDTATNA